MTDLSYSCYFSPSYQPILISISTNRIVSLGGSGESHDNNSNNNNDDNNDNDNQDDPKAVAVGSATNKQPQRDAPRVISRLRGRTNSIILPVNAFSNPYSTLPS